MTQVSRGNQDLSGLWHNRDHYKMAPIVFITFFLDECTCNPNLRAKLQCLPAPENVAQLYRMYNTLGGKTFTPENKEQTKYVFT